MRNVKERILNIAIAVVTLLAVFTGGLRAKEWWEGPYQDRPKRIANWERYADGGHQIGPTTAAVTIVEFADYECPFCRTASEEVERILHDYEGRVRLVYRHYPLAFHAEALPAARAVICASRQGKFEPYHNLLFDAGVVLANKPWNELASTAGVADTAGFRACAEETSPLAEVARDTVLANELGFVGTPLFLVNGMRFSGYPERGFIEKFVKEALEQSERTK